MMARARKWLFRTPALFGAGFLAFCAFQIGWNWCVAVRWPELAFHLKYPPGYVADSQVAPTWANLLDGSFQRDEAARIGVQSMLYRPVIRWKHQVYYSLLGMSGLPNIIVGKQKQLIETGYMEEYCSRDPAAMRQVAPVWSERIRALQDQFEARGQIFLYVITPSKVALHPEYLPDNYPCPGRAHADEKLAVYRQALQRAGVHYVDGPAVMRGALGHYALDLYPRGGIHWNMTGAALAAQTVAKALDDEGAHIAPLTFTVSSTYNVVDDWDRDLADVLNLVYKDVYAVPALTFRSQADGPCRPARIAEDAGSFIFQVNDVLEHTACPPQIHPYFYWINLTLRGADTHLHKQPENAEQRRADFLQWADIVILEENEASLPQSTHARNLIAMMQANAEASR
jgi:alginate O-acetyltransferase complex protein AlgJ